jgi:hypothetical protein
MSDTQKSEAINGSCKNKNVSWAKRVQVFTIPCTVAAKEQYIHKKNYMYSFIFFSYLVYFVYVYYNDANINKQKSQINKQTKLSRTTIKKKKIINPKKQINNI